MLDKDSRQRFLASHQRVRFRTLSTANKTERGPGQGPNTHTHTRTHRGQCKPVRRSQTTQTDTPHETPKTNEASHKKQPNTQKTPSTHQHAHELNTHSPRSPTNPRPRRHGPRRAGGRRRGPAPPATGEHGRRPRGQSQQGPPAARKRHSAPFALAIYHWLLRDS